MLCAGGGALVGVLWCALAGVLRVLWWGGLVGPWLVLHREGRRRRTPFRAVSGSALWGAGGVLGGGGALLCRCSGGGARPAQNGGDPDLGPRPS